MGIYKGYDKYDRTSLALVPGWFQAGPRLVPGPKSQVLLSLSG